MIIRVLIRPRCLRPSRPVCTSPPHNLTSHHSPTSNHRHPPTNPIPLPLVQIRGCQTLQPSPSNLSSLLFRLLLLLPNHHLQFPGGVHPPLRRPNKVQRLHPDPVRALQPQRLHPCVFNLEPVRVNVDSQLGKLFRLVPACVDAMLVLARIVQELPAVEGKRRRELELRGAGRYGICPVLPLENVRGAVRGFSCRKRLARAHPSLASRVTCGSRQRGSRPPRRIRPR